MRKPFFYIIILFENDKPAFGDIQFQHLCPKIDLVEPKKTVSGSYYELRTRRHEQFDRCLHDVI